MSISFPRIPAKKDDITKRLDIALEQNLDYQKGFILGYPGTTPHSSSTNALQKFIPQNPNNIGTHTSGVSEAGFVGTQKLERDSVFMVADLFMPIVFITKLMVI